MSNLKNNPMCPHCEYEFDSDETWHNNYSDTGKVYTGDGDESELKCPNLDCGKAFITICENVVMFGVVEED